MALTPPKPRPLHVRPRARPAARPGRTTEPAGSPRRIARNFALLSLAEIVCRGTSVAVTLELARRLDPAGFGRIEFAFSAVVWLVLLVREGFDVLSAREIARHPRLVRPLVNHVLAIKATFATVLLAGLAAVERLTLSDPIDQGVLSLYALMLVTTALGLDFVYRGLERMGIVAISLVIRTALYAAGTLALVTDSARVVWVPACLVGGEAIGIALVWACYARTYGLPRPSLRGGRFLRVFWGRGKSVYVIQVTQAVIASMDLMIVGLTSSWGEVGLYSAPHRMVTALLTFGLIFQQVVLPSLARTWRDGPYAGRRALDRLVRILAIGMLPVAVGTTILADSLVRVLFAPSFGASGLLLAIGVWRAPVLMIAYLYQTALIALDRESAGVRMLLAGVLGSAGLSALLRWGLGLPGAGLGLLGAGTVLAFAGYGALRAEGREPAWHHHLGKPLVASLAMAPVCLLLRPIHIALAIAAGGAVYFAVLAGLGGIKRADFGPAAAPRADASRRQAA